MARRSVFFVLLLLAPLLLAACDVERPSTMDPAYMGAQGPTGPGQNQHALGGNGM
jgi:hypothetical protein